MQYACRSAENWTALIDIFDPLILAVSEHSVHNRQEVRVGDRRLVDLVAANPPTGWRQHAAVGMATEGSAHHLAGLSLTGRRRST